MTIPEQLEQLIDYMLRRDAEVRERFFQHVGCLPEDIFNDDSGLFIRCEWKH